ncbi:alkylglycerol monooxygenase [Protopterus annectens]|uniref:alkylglycerol monooxygenase n=1 Tax=Protopterus annectens TaxID=7888 RepID=UPI001CF9DD47|nr:alkylglycerol monooxygenase [Protopterus annectens]
MEIHGGKMNLGILQKARVMFYMVTPNETQFEHTSDVPEYVQQATPLFIGMVLLEFFLSWAKNGKISVRINDGITSLSAGVMSRLLDVFVRSLEIYFYIYVWDKFRLCELPWDSAWTWWLSFVGVDFGYYWVHRMSHEVNILWSAHQAHHSSEDYNLTTALRQSLMQKWFSWIFYLPMALFIPPSVFAVHIQFNLLYQFWIHTEYINKLGPLELILNTPSHHRVHHGRNPYCIDTNYGGTLIIWDRIFGTFAAESDKVMYGLTHPINTFEPFAVQFQHLLYIWNTFWSAPGFYNKLSILFKGPGWGPGKPRLGLPEEIPKITGEEKPYDPGMTGFLQIYAVVHFILMLDIYEDMFVIENTLSELALVFRIFYILLTLTALGFFMDQRASAPFLEAIRCSIFLILHNLDLLKPFTDPVGYAVQIFFFVSAALWGMEGIARVISWKTKQQ